MKKLLLFFSSIFLSVGVHASCTTVPTECGSSQDVSDRSALQSSCPPGQPFITMGFVCSDESHTLYSDLCVAPAFWFRNCQITADSSRVGSGRLPSPADSGGNNGQCPATESGSVINIDAQTFTESIPIVGTDWSLTYDSQRAIGYKQGRSINIAVLGSSPPSNLTSVDVELDFAGRTENFSLTPADNLNFMYTWDHFDSGTNRIFKAIPITYKAKYKNGTPFELEDQRTLTIGSFVPTSICMAGWNITPVHFLDVDLNRVWYGDGTFKNTEYKTLSTGELATLSEDGKQVYIFNADGRHIQTKSAVTGEVLLSMTYDLNHCLTKIEDAFGNDTVINRSSSLITGITSPYGKVTSMSLDSNGYIASVTNPASETYNMTYSSSGLMATFQKPEGQTTTFTYDADGNLTKELGAFGNFWQLLRDVNQASKPLYKTSQAGVSTKYEVAYNPETKRSTRSEVQPSGETYSYQSGSSSRNMTAPNETALAYQWLDPIWGTAGQYTNQIQISNAYHTQTTNISKSATLSNSADPFSIVSLSTTTTTGTLGASVTTENYTASTKEFITTTTEGMITKRTIDNYGRTVQQQLGSDTPWETAFDSRGRVSYTKQGSRFRKDFTYNTDGTLQKTKDALNQETLFSYDLAGRVATVTKPDLTVVSYEYDKNGNITGITPPSRPKHSFEFNLFEGLSKYSPPNLSFTPKDTTFGYNLDKQLTSITRPDGQTATYSYNSATGLLSSITVPTGNYGTLYYANSSYLNAIGGPYGIKDVFQYNGTRVLFDEQRRRSDEYVFGRVTWYYDTSFIDKPSSRVVKGNSSTTYSQNYYYNNDAALNRVGELYLYYSYPSGRVSSTKLDNIFDAVTFDAYGDLDTYTAKYVDPSTSVETILYSYSLTRNLNGKITQKIETIGGTTTTWDYQYDSQGRVTEVKKNSAVYSSYVYDDNGNKVSGQTGGNTFTSTFDDQDRLLTYNSRVYSYNKNGDLTQIQWNTTDNTYYSYDIFGNLSQFTEIGGTVHDYIVDPFNRRVGKKIGATNVNYRYLYENQYRIAAQLTGPGVVQKLFTYATSVNVPDYMTISGVRYRIIKDQVGSPRLVVKSTDGSIQQQIEYDDLGKILSDTNPGFQPFGFAGGIYDAPSKLVKFGARDYDAETGRWTTKDPLLFGGGDTNLFGYVENDPINFIDPDGEMKLPADPGGLPPGWAPDPTHKDPNGERWRYKDTDRYLDYHKGKPNGSRGGNQKLDHWHDSKDGRHKPLLPGDEVSDPEEPCPNPGSGVKFQPNTGPYMPPFPIFPIGGGGGRALNPY